MRAFRLLPVSSFTRTTRGGERRRDEIEGTAQRKEKCSEEEMKSIATRERKRMVKRRIRRNCAVTEIRRKGRESKTERERRILQHTGEQKRWRNESEEAIQ